MPLNYSKKEIKILFNTRLKKRLNFMDEERISIKNNLIICTILIIPFAFTALVQIPKSANLQIYVGGSFILFIPLAIKGYLKFRAFRKKYKTQIIDEILKIILPDSHFIPSGYISSVDYKASKIFTSDHNRYNGEDLIKSKYNNIPFEFSELHTKLITGSGKNRRERTIFKGIFFSCSLPIKSEHNTLIVPDLSEKILGKVLGQFFQSHNIARDKLIKLENPEFEKTFAIYGTSQIEARKLLTPVIMERILKYNRLSKHDISLSFRKNKLYMAIPTTKNYFEPQIFRKIKFNDIIEICKILETVTTVLDNLGIENKQQEVI